MSTALILLLAIAGGVTLGCWKYTRMARFQAVAWWLDSFTATFVVPDLTAAIAVSMNDPLWFGTVVGLDVLGGFTAWHEIGTGEHHHPVRTHLLCIAGGAAAAATVVDLPKVTHQLVHLPVNVLHALMSLASAARHTASSGTMTAAQAHHILLEAAMAAAAVVVVIWRVHRKRVRAAQAPIRERVAIEDARRQEDPEKAEEIQRGRDLRAIAAGVAAQHAPRPWDQVRGVGLFHGARKALKGKKPDADFQKVPRGARGGGHPAGDTGAPFAQFQQMTGRPELPPRRG